MSNLIIDKIRTKKGDAVLNYSSLANKPELAPLEVTISNINDAISLSADYSAIDTAFQAGRWVYLKDENDNLYFPAKRTSGRYEFVHISQDQSYTQVTVSAEAITLASHSFIVNLILKYNDTGAPQNSNWEKYIAAPDLYEPLLLNTETQEQYLFKENDGTQSLFFTFGYDVETGVVVYKEAVLAQDGSVTFQTQSLTAATSYLGVNGVTVTQGTENTIGLEYGISKFSEDQDIPCIADTISTVDTFTASFTSIQSDFPKDTLIKIYELKDGEKILVEDSPKYYQDEDGYFYVGVNINEEAYDSTSYTIRDSSLTLHGILKLTLSEEKLRYTGFCSKTAGASFLVTGAQETISYIPEAMTKWGKFTSQVLDLTGSIDSLENLPKEAADYIPMIESDESWRALDGLYLHCGKNNTLDFNYLYSLNSIRFLNGYNGEEVSADLEIGSATVDNFFKSAFLNIYWELDYLYYGFEAINRRSYSLSRLSGLNPSFRYYRINISSSLEDIVVNKTWTVTDSSSPSVLLVLLTTSNSIQVWLPIVIDNTTDLFIAFLNVKRPYYTKAEIPISWLPIYKNSITSTGNEVSSDTLLNSYQVEQLIQAYLSTYDGLPIDSSPTEGSSNPISSGAIYTLATELNTEIYGRPTSSDVNNLIAAASIDYETQVMNKPTIPTAASIQAELAYDTTPTENSSNLIKSGDLYSVQQSLVENINGKTKGYVFDTNSELQTWLTDENKAKLKVGDVLYIKETGYPDYWWDGTNTQYLETQKVDLADYVKTETLENYQTIADRDIKIETLTANVSNGLNTHSLKTEKNSTFAYSLSEVPSVPRSLFHATANHQMMTVLQCEDLCFTFNSGQMAPYRSLDFIASLGITINDESWWYGSDPIMFENSSGTFFLQAWISDSNNLFCIKRTDYSTQQVEVVSELPSTTDSSTLYFVTS